MLQSLLFLLVALTPGLIFSGALIYFDCYKLVKVSQLIWCLLLGTLVTFLAYYSNGMMLDVLDIDFVEYTHYVSPPIEESLKIIALILLYIRVSPAFTIQTVILGFTLGLGFGLAENVVYLFQSESTTLHIQLIRGFGTAFLHGGTVALFALFLENPLNKKMKFFNKALIVLMAFLLICVLHAIFNFFLLTPILQTIIVFTLLPCFFYITFKHSQKNIKDWINAGINSNIQMLDMLSQISTEHNNLSTFFSNISHSFSKEIELAIHSYMRIFLELSIRTKSILMMREYGFDAPLDDKFHEKISELKLLEGAIGKAGLLLITPILDIKRADVWKL